MEIAFYQKQQEVKIVHFLKNYFSSATKNKALIKLNDSILYSLTTPGKRFRPILTLAANHAVGGDEEKALPLAGAIEMIHTYSLIHDDLPAMDNDDMRRGQPTNHKVFGDAIAILAGDALLTESFYLLSNLKIDSALQSEIISDIALAIGMYGMIGGQIIDIELTGVDVTFPELEALHIRKTGALIKVSLTSGAKIANATESQIKSLKTYGENLGLAFQISDDILDESQDQDSNAFYKKATYPRIVGLQESKERAKELIKKAILALADFDDKANYLRELAQTVLKRIPE